MQLMTHLRLLPLSPDDETIILDVIRHVFSVAKVEHHRIVLLVPWLRIPETAAASRIRLLRRLYLIGALQAHYHLGRLLDTLDPIDQVLLKLAIAQVLLRMLRLLRRDERPYDADLLLGQRELALLLASYRLRLVVALGIHRRRSRGLDQAQTTNGADGFALRHDQLLLDVLLVVELLGSESLLQSVRRLGGHHQAGRCIGRNDRLVPGLYFRATIIFRYSLVRRSLSVLLHTR